MWKGFDHQTPFKGTMFRLPLRTAEQAQHSRLSRTERDVHGTLALLHEFAQQSTEMLLFLKNVLSVEIFKWLPGEAAPTRISSTSVQDADSSLAAARTFMSSAQCTNRAAGMQPVTQDFEMSIRFEGPSGDAVHTSGAAAAGAPPAPQSIVTTWLVANQMGAPQADAVAARPEVKQLKLQPWSGVAACVSRVVDGVAAPASLQGRAYCFLPLPVITGLPVHVNGYFELSSNRRDIWLGDRDMIGQGKLRAEWNAALLQGIAAPCYARVLIAAVKRTKTKSTAGGPNILQDLQALYALWPTSKPSSAWGSVVVGALKALADEPVLYAAPASSAPMVDGSVLNQDGASGTWIAPNTAVFCEDTVDTQWPGLRRALTQEGLPLVQVPAHVTAVLHTAGIISDAQTFSPEVVRAHYRAAAGKQGASCVSLEDQSIGIQLLKYASSDLLLAGHTDRSTQSSGAARHSSEDTVDFSPLVGLPLLPLASGDMAVFQAPPQPEHAAILKELQAFGFDASQCAAALIFVREHYASVALRGGDDLRQQALQVLTDGTQLDTDGLEAASQPVYFPTIMQRSVLAAAPAARARMVAAPSVLGEDAAALLSRPALKSSTNLSDMKPEHMSELLVLALPEAWTAQQSVQWDESRDGHPSRQWLQAVWAYLAAEVQDLSPFAASIPIVPILGGRLVSLQAVPCSITVNLTADFCDSDAQTLQALGLQILDNAATGLQSLHADMHNYVFQSTPQDILAALYARSCAAHVSGSLSPSPEEAEPAKPKSDIDPRLDFDSEEDHRHADMLHSAAEALFALGAASSASGNVRLSLARLLAPVDFSKLAKHLKLLLQCLSILPCACGLSLGDSNSIQLRVVYNAATPFKPVAPSVLDESGNMEACTTLSSPASVSQAVLWPPSLGLFPDVFSPRSGVFPHQLPIASADTLGAEAGAAVHSLATALHVQSPSAEKVIRDMLLPLLSEASVLQATAIGCAILQGLPSSVSKPTLDAVRNAKMVRRSSSGAADDGHDSLAAASELYDTQNDDLRALLPEGMFPAETSMCLLTYRDAVEAAREFARGQAAAEIPSVSEERTATAQTTSVELVQPRQILDEAALDALKRLGLRSVLGSREISEATASVTRLSDAAYARRVFKYVHSHAFELFGRWVGPAAMGERDAIAFHGGHALRSAIAHAQELEKRRLQEEQRRRRQSSGFLTRMFSSASDSEPLPAVQIDETQLPEYQQAKQAMLQARDEANDLVACLQSTAWVPVCTSAEDAHAVWRSLSGESAAAVAADAVPWPETPIAPFAAVDAGADGVRHLVLGTHVWSHSGSCSVLCEPVSDPSMLWLLRCSATAPNLTPMQAADQLILLGKSTDTPTVPGPVLHVVGPVVVDLYKVLDNFVRAESADSSDVTSLKDKLADKPWLWTQTQSGFVSSDVVACIQDFDCSPYLHSVPQPLAFAQDSLVRLGVQRSFTPNAFAQLLVRLNDSYPECLPANCVEMAVFSISKVADAVQDASGVRRLLLDEHCRLQPSAACVYNDFGGERGQKGIDDVRASSSTDAPVFMTHEKIPNAAAKALGAMSLTRRMLASNSELLPMGSESFGQSEDLTQRLRHIIDMYPEGSSMVAEHVQNADDAGASVVKIILDAHTYGTASLFGDGLAKWQGPALMVYNDGVFSERDFQAIARVGQAGKMEQANSTGRFGLGFCGNYALTDVPTIVSSDCIVMFDPHLSSVPGADAKQPGLRMRFADATAVQGDDTGAPGSSQSEGAKKLGHLAEQYSDQLAPFVALGCTFDGPFAGTIFRFPLRNPTTAACSRIKPKDPIAHNPVEALLQMCSAYRAVSEHVLLFTKSVRRIECSFVAPGAGPRPEEQMVFSVEVGGRAHVPRHGINVRSSSEWAVVPWDDSEQLLKAADEAWRACGTFMKYGSTKPTTEATLLTKSEAIETIHATPPPQLPLTYQILTMHIKDFGQPNSTEGSSKPVEKLHEYFVHSRLGAGRARRMAFEHRDSLKFIPGASVAVLLAVNGQAVCVRPASVNNTSRKSDGDEMELYVDSSVQSTSHGNPGAAAAMSNVDFPAETEPGTVSLDIRFETDAPTPTFQPQGSAALGLIVQMNGRAFCTLPLPASTGLPMLVSAGFELASDRRNLRHGQDMEGISKIKALWNVALLQDIVAPSYCRALIQMRDSLDASKYGCVMPSRLVEVAKRLLTLRGGTTHLSKLIVDADKTGSRPHFTVGGIEDETAVLPTGRKLGSLASLTAYYSLWPKSSAVEPWTPITDSVLSILFRLNLPLFFAPGHFTGDIDDKLVFATGSWLPPTHRDSPILFLPMQDDDFTTLDRLLRPDQEDALLEQSVFFKEPTMFRLLFDVWPALLRLDRAVVPVPQHVFDFVKSKVPASANSIQQLSASNVRRAFITSALPATAGGFLSDDDFLLLRRCFLFACSDLPLATEQQLGFSGDEAVQSRLAALTSSADLQLARVLLAAHHVGTNLTGCSLHPSNKMALRWGSSSTRSIVPDFNRTYVLDDGEASQPMWAQGSSSAWVTCQSDDPAVQTALKQLAELSNQARALCILDLPSSQRLVEECGLEETLIPQISSVVQVARECAPDLQHLNLACTSQHLSIPLPDAAKAICMLHQAAITFLDCFLHGAPEMWSHSQSAQLPWRPVAPGGVAASGPAQEGASQPTKQWMRSMWKWLGKRIATCVSLAGEKHIGQFVAGSLWSVLIEQRAAILPVYSLKFAEDGSPQKTQSVLCLTSPSSSRPVPSVFDPRGCSEDLVALLCGLGAVALDVASMGCPMQLDQAPGGESWVNCSDEAFVVMALVQTQQVFGGDAPSLLALIQSCVKARLESTLADQADMLMQQALYALREQPVEGGNLSSSSLPADDVDEHLGSILAAMLPTQLPAVRQTRPWAELHCRLICGLQSTSEAQAYPQWKNGENLTDSQVGWLACLPLWRSMAPFERCNGRPFAADCKGLDRLETCNLLQARLLAPSCVHPIVLNGSFLASGLCFFQHHATVPAVVAKASNEAELHLLRFAGVYSVSMDVLVTQFLLPRIAAAPPVVQCATTWAIAQAIQNKFVNIETIATLKSTRWVVAANSSDADVPIASLTDSSQPIHSSVARAPVRLASPNSLYMRSEQLESLLPRTSFPARRPLLPQSIKFDSFAMGTSAAVPQWLEDGFALLDHVGANQLDNGLKGAGVHTELQPEGVLVAARGMAAEAESIQREAESASAAAAELPLHQITDYMDIPKHLRVEILKSRTFQLLRYLSTGSNLIQLCRACKDHVSAARFLRELGEVKWLPVQACADTNPVQTPFGENHEILWCPIHVRGLSEAPFVSASYACLLNKPSAIPVELRQRNFPQIFALPTENTGYTQVPPALQHAWGWDRPAPAQVYATQLLQQASAWTASPPSSGHAQDALLEKTHVLYGLLSSSMNISISADAAPKLHHSQRQAHAAVIGVDTAAAANDADSDAETETEGPGIAEHIRDVLIGSKSWIYVGASEGFLPSQRVALRGLEAARPHLYELPKSLYCFAQMFQQLGVNDVFSAQSLCASVAALPAPLCDSDVAFCAVVLKTLLAGTNRAFHEEASESTEAPDLETANSVVAAERLAVWRSQIQRATLKAPAADGGLHPISELAVDDLVSVSEDEKKRLLAQHYAPHELLLDSAACLLALGATSLSSLLAADSDGQSLPMPGLSTLQDCDKGAGGSVSTSLADVFEVARCIGSRSCDVTFCAGNLGNFASAGVNSPVHWQNGVHAPRIEVNLTGTTIKTSGMMKLSSLSSMLSFPASSDLGQFSGRGGLETLNPGSAGILGVFNICNFCIVVSGSNLYCMNAGRMNSVSADEVGEMCMYDLAHPAAAALKSGLQPWFNRVFASSGHQLHEVGDVQFFYPGVAICIPLQLDDFSNFENSCVLKPEDFGFEFGTARLPNPVTANPRFPACPDDDNVLARLWFASKAQMQGILLSAPQLERCSLSLLRSDEVLHKNLNISRMDLGDSALAAFLPDMDAVRRIMPRSPGGLVSGLFKRASAALEYSTVTVSSIRTDIGFFPEADRTSDAVASSGPAAPLQMLSLQETWVSVAPRATDAAGRIPTVRLIAPVDRRLIDVDAPSIQWPNPSTDHCCFPRAASGGVIRISNLCKSCVLPPSGRLAGDAVTGFERMGSLWLRGIPALVDSCLPVDVVIDGAVDRTTRKLILPHHQVQSSGSAAGPILEFRELDEQSIPPAAAWNVQALAEQIPKLYPSLLSAFTQVSRRQQEAQRDAFQLWPRFASHAQTSPPLALAVKFDPLQHLIDSPIWPRWRPGLQVEQRLIQDKQAATAASRTAAASREELQFGHKCTLSRSLIITQDTPLPVAEYMSGWNSLVSVPPRIKDQLLSSRSETSPWLLLSRVTVAEAIERAVTVDPACLFTSPPLAAFVLCYLLGDTDSVQNTRSVPDAVDWPSVSRPGPGTEPSQLAEMAPKLQGAPLLPLACDGLARLAKQPTFIASTAQLMLCDDAFLTDAGSGAGASGGLLAQALHPGLFEEARLRGVPRTQTPVVYASRFDFLSGSASQDCLTQVELQWVKSSLASLCEQDDCRAALGLKLMGVADMVPFVRQVIPNSLYRGPTQVWRGQSSAAASGSGDQPDCSEQLSPLWLKLFWSTVHMSSTDNMEALGDLCLIPLRSGHLLSCKHHACAAPEHTEQRQAHSVLQSGLRKLSSDSFSQASLETQAALDDLPQSASVSPLDAWLLTAGAPVLHSAFVPQRQRMSASDESAFSRVQLTALYKYAALPGHAGMLGPGVSWRSLRPEQREGLLNALQHSGCPLDDQLRDFLLQQELFKTISGRYISIFGREAATLSAETLHLSKDTIEQFRSEVGGMQLPTGIEMVFNDVLSTVTGESMEQVDDSASSASEPDTAAAAAAPALGGAAAAMAGNTSSSDSAFLRPILSLSRIYEQLGVTSAQLPVVLHKHVLPHFGQLQPGRQAALAAAICARWSDLRDNSDLCSALQELKWIPSDAALASAAATGAGSTSQQLVGAYEAGPLVKPKALLHPHHRLARRGIPPGNGVFPCPACCSTVWIAMLLDLGMPSTMNADQLLCALKLVEEQAEREASQGSSGQAAGASGDSDSLPVSRRLASIAHDLLRAGWDSVHPGSDGVPSDTLRAQRSRYPPLASSQHGNSDASSTPLLLLEVHQRAVASMCVVPAWRPGPICRQLQAMDLEESAIAGGSNEEIALFRYSACVQREHQVLAWSQLAILPQQCVPPVGAWPRVQLPSTPNPSIIVKHLQQLVAAQGDAAWSAASLTEWSAPEPPLVCLSKAIQTLQDADEPLSASDQAWLRSAAFVPIGASYVPLRRLFFRLPRAAAIAPLAFEVPRALGAHEQWLKQMGVAETPAASQYCDLLREIATESSGAALSPAELQGALAIAELLGEAASDPAADDLTGNTGQAADALDMSGFTISEVNIPDVFAVMQPACSCHVNDMQWAAPFLQADAVQLSHPQLRNHTALALGCTRLSSVVHEHRVAGPLAGSNDQLPSAQALAAVLSSQEFAGVVVAAATAGQNTHVQGRPPATMTASQTRAHEGAIKSSLARLKPVFVQSVESTLSIQAGKGSSEIARCSALWAKQLAEGSDSLMVSTSHFSAGVSPAEAACRAVVQLLMANDMVSLPEETRKLCSDGLEGNALNALCVFVSQALKFGVQQAQLDFNLTLQAFRLPSHDDGNTSSASFVSQQQLLRGVPGEPLQEVDAALLALQPARQFVHGDVVAVDLACQAFGSGMSSAAGHSKVYGRVAGVTSAAAGPVSSLSVNLGPHGTHRLRSDQVFVFSTAQRSSAAPQGKATAKPPPAAAAAAAAVPPSVPPAAAQSTHAAKDVESAEEERSEQTLLLQALADLRQRAGLGPSLEEEEAVRAVARHEAAVTAARQEVSRLQAKVQEATQAAADAQGMVACGICQEAEVDHVLVPCGHTICGSCVDKINDVCPWCRKSMQHKIKMFHP